MISAAALEASNWNHLCPAHLCEPKESGAMFSTKASDWQCNLEALPFIDYLDFNGVFCLPHKLLPKITDHRQNYFVIQASVGQSGLSRMDTTT